MTTEEVVQDVLTMTTETSKEMPQDIEFQIERTSQEDQTKEVIGGFTTIGVDHETTQSEEVVHETIETQDEDDYILVNFLSW